MNLIAPERKYKAFFVFGGLGGGAIGMMKAQARFRGILARFRILGSVDSDPLACQDFEMFTGVKATCMDLFDRDQYRAWHGKEPPPEWREASPEDIRAAAQNEAPDVAVITAPCKGFSGLLPTEKSKSERYQALNRLTYRGIFLTLLAWEDNLPGLILFENVPRITTRGKKFLVEIKALLSAYGYLFHEGHHDCGELGGLGQHRRRYLMIARHPAKVSSFVYQPPKLRVRSIGEVLSEIRDEHGREILPDDPAGGPMHKLPLLEWKTWVRLALIPPGGDWRDLQNIEAGRYRIVPAPGKHHMKFRVQDSNDPSATATGITDVQAGAQIVAAPQDYMDPATTFPHKYFILDTQDAGATVTSARLGSGGMGIAAPEINHKPMGGGKGAFHVPDSDDSSGAVTSDPSHRKSGGDATLADPRPAYEPRDGSHRVGDSNDPATLITGSAAVTSSNGMAAVAAPETGFNNSHRVTLVDDSCPTITSQGGPSNGAIVVAAPQYDRQPRAGVYDVQDSSDPSHAVTMGKDANGNMLHIADPSVEKFSNMLRMPGMDDTAVAVTGAAGPYQSGSLTADYRFGCQARNGTMGVGDNGDPGGTVIASGDQYTGGTGSVADWRPQGQAEDPVRIPADDERGNWVIISPHKDKKGRHCRHRPLTKLELMALQSLPTKRPDGTPVVLAGKSVRAWCERIGNAWPPDAAEAVGVQMLYPLMLSETGEWSLSLSGTPIWVQQEDTAETAAD